MMKRAAAALLILAVLSFVLLADERDILEKARLFIDQKNYAAAMETIDKGIKDLGEIPSLLQAKYNVLLRTAKFEEALQLIEKRIANEGEIEDLTQEKYFLLVELGRLEEALKIIEKLVKERGGQASLLQEKYYLLMELERYSEALDIAIRKDKSTPSKLPLNSIDIARTFLKMNDVKKAGDWLEEAVERGFIYYSDSYVDDLREHEDKRIAKIFQKIKDKLGIGKPVKDVSLVLLTGEKFTISEQKSRVLLIDFWATWCAPCREEMPYLKVYYDEFREKGFEIIGISLDREKKDLERYLSEEKIGWKISFSGEVWDDKTARLFGVYEIPSYWLVDKDGILREFGLRRDKLREAIIELLSK